MTTIYKVPLIASYPSLITLMEAHHGLTMRQQKTLIFTYGIWNPEIGPSRNILWLLRKGHFFPTDMPVVYNKNKVKLVRVACTENCQD